MIRSTLPRRLAGVVLAPLALALASGGCRGVETDALAQAETAALTGFADPVSDTAPAVGDPALRLPPLDAGPPELYAGWLYDPPRDSLVAARFGGALPEGWPVDGPRPLPGSILPHRRIVAFYGNPNSTRMGILGEIAPERMLAKLDGEIAAWRAADPHTPVIPALHMVAMVAQAEPGRDGHYRARMSDEAIGEVHEWARSRDALLFVDLQVGTSTIQREVPRFEEWLSRPDVHLGLDPEFAMKGGHRPGTRIGTLDAEEINWAIRYLARLVDEHDLPPKVLVIHRFTRPMITHADRIELDPRVQVVIDMDGWGPPRLKRDSYEHYVVSEPVQYTGFKLFYGNDTRNGSRLMTPDDVLALRPRPIYIQYQ